MEILWSLQAHVIELEVGVELLICRLEVLRIILPAFEHCFRTEVGEVRIIDLSITESSIVEDFQFGLVGFGDVGKVVVVIGVSVVQVGFLRPITEVVPGSGQ